MVPHGYKSREELLEIHREAFRRFYMRPKYIIRKVSKIRSFSELKKNLVGLKVIKGMTASS